MKKLVLFFAVAMAGCSSSKPATPAATEAVKAPAATVATSSEPPMIPFGTKMKCPVSGEDFTVSPKTTQIVFEGKRYAFCCDDCLPEFNKNPAKFAQK
jgi:YHS domain-containing protein